MDQSPVSLWPWLVQTCGSVGAVVVVIMAVVAGLSWLLTPVYVWRLHRKGAIIEDLLIELKGMQSRQQQVERLQRDRDGKKPRRRRR